MTDEIHVDGIFQARVSSKRESRAGIFLTVEISADDYSPALAQLRAGSLLKMGWQELVDTSVQKIEVESFGVEPRSSRLARELKGGGANNERSGPQGSSGPDNTQPQVEPVATPGAHPKRKFSELSLPEQAGIRCGETRFWEFVCEKFGYMPECPESPRFVRVHCGIKSRSELSTNHDAANKWRDLNRQFEAWALDQKYAGVRR